jgi:Phytanoyl-CoA dioxygenase (PhyH)
MILDVGQEMTAERLQGLYAEHGVLVLRGFYDQEADIAPVLEDIRRIIELVAAKYGIDADCSTSLAAMTEGYRAVIGVDRRFGGEVYDAVKQSPSFIRLLADRRHEDLYRTIAPGCVPGIAAGGYGIRIDNPFEEKFRAQWHQEFPAQLRSLDGVVFWSPLLSVTRDMGPVQVLPGSHLEGLLQTRSDSAGAGKSGAYALFLENEDAIVSRYSVVEPLLEPGDLIVMNFLLLHQSGFNTSDRPRWSMQFRYFNFADPVGTAIGWKGSFAAGIDFHEVLKDLAPKVLS